MARVVLIFKAGKPVGTPSSYRPICLLNTLSKLYEVLVRDRLVCEMERGEDLAPNQFGFRRGRSNIQAIEEIMTSARGANEKWCVLIALDVKNAFNSAQWGHVTAEMDRRYIPGYLVNIVGEYLRGRKVMVAGSEVELHAGVPQGSILGPLLWNIFYDGVLKLELPDGVMTVGFADDLAILVRASDSETLMHRANWAMDMVRDWLLDRGLELASQKTEAVILKGPRDRAGVTFRLAGTRIEHQKGMRYLGVTIDSGRTFAAHVRRVVEKAERVIATLNSIMPNIGGPRGKKREMLCGVVHSVILYGAPIWHGALRMEKYRAMLETTQRRAILRVARAYRTVSTRAAQVLAGILPIDILVEERRWLYATWEGHLPENKKIARERSMEAWQNRWDNTTDTSQWTKRLIPDLSRWMSCPHREAGYGLTQFLSRHGSFKVFTRKIGKEEDDVCMYCESIDTPEHTVLVCMRWERLRAEAQAETGVRLNVDNIVNEMIGNARRWKICTTMVEKIMAAKEREERDFQNRRRQQNRQ